MSMIHLNTNELIKWGYFMTNFEQWIKDLTVEKLIQYFENGFFDGCTDCPAFVFCRERMTKDGDCFEMFTTWANIKV